MENAQSINQNWLKTHQLEQIPLGDIPTYPLDELMSQLRDRLSLGLRIIALFGKPDIDNQIYIFAILADDVDSALWIAQSKTHRGVHYNSLTPHFPQVQLFERELYEMVGIVPDNHPWLKPVRQISDYSFFTIQSDETHQVGVGPVHAGIIEPGHFRFSCKGEQILHLEIQLGYQHRGIERQLRDADIHPSVIESICGDSSVAYALAYAGAVETLTQSSISLQSDLTRAIALELERVAVHIGNLSAICSDIAYTVGSATLQALRTQVINTSMAICGSRFGRGWVRPGGVRYGITGDLKLLLQERLKSVRRDLVRCADTIFSAASVLSRIEGIGIVAPHTAATIGLIGLAARASGQETDSRKHHPTGCYRHSPPQWVTRSSGDVYARTYNRYLEAICSIDWILARVLELSDSFDFLAGYSKERKYTPNTMVISLVEGGRGEIVHIVQTNSVGKIDHYKIKDPSFHNWFGLTIAVKNGAISDFPLCNKSFDLSYCGQDL